MNIDIPANIECEIEQFAQQQSIPPNEAAIRLIERGLSVGNQAPKALPAKGLGMFRSAEEAAIMDGVVAIAYQERRRPSSSEIFD